MKEQKDQKQNMKNKGITLIALVVTIVVLLILAAVSISMLTGENGVITQAQDAKDKTEIGEEKEQVQLAATAAKGKTNWGEITEDNFRAELDNNIGSGKYTLSKNWDIFTVTYNDSKRSYEVDADGNITEQGEASLIATMIIEGEKVETPPLPSSDFTHIDGTVDTGYVIKDSKGNEFVWVPVDKNQKIKINVTSKEKIDSISLTDPYGDEILLENTENLGTSYNNQEVEPKINGPYRLTVTSGEENKTIELNVTSLYAQRMWELEMLTEDIARAKGYASLEQFMQNFFNMPENSTVEDTKNMIISTYKSGMFIETEEDHKQSVNDNGGFYIARYEASYENENVISKKSTIANTNSTLENGKLWNNISQEEALTKSKAMYTGAEFTSSLLTGAAWDRTLSWLEETEAVSAFEIVGDSKNWGNYNDDTFSNTTGLINTGEYEETEKNHIYDLAGNLSEWTTEAYDTDLRVYRGRQLQRWRF